MDGSLSDISLLRENELFTWKTEKGVFSFSIRRDVEERPPPQKKRETETEKERVYNLRKWPPSVANCWTLLGSTSDLLYYQVFFWILCLHAFFVTFVLLLDSCYQKLLDFQTGSTHLLNKDKKVSFLSVFLLSFIYMVSTLMTFWLLFVAAQSLPTPVFLPVLKSTTGFEVLKAVGLWKRVWWQERIRNNVFINNKIYSNATFCDDYIIQKLISSR